MIERAYSALAAAGLDVRRAMQHNGVCTSPYCVVYEGQDEAPGRSIVVRHVLVDVMVPWGKPALLADAVRKVTVALAVGFSRSTVGQAAVLEEYRAISQTVDFAAPCGR